MECAGCDSKAEPANWQKTVPKKKMINEQRGRKSDTDEKAGHDGRFAKGRKKGVKLVAKS